MDQSRRVHVEIMPAESDRQERTVTISSGSNGSTVRRVVPVASLQAFMRLLSEPNVQLLSMIRTRRPRSVAELARLTGRPKASLTQTLRRLEKFGLVMFRQSSGRRKVPEVSCEMVTLDVVISTEPSSANAPRQVDAPASRHGN